MIRLIFYLLLFYFLYKALLYFLKYLAGGNKKTHIRKDNAKPSGFKDKRDIEEADYREIKDDDDKS